MREGRAWLHPAAAWTGTGGHVAGSLHAARPTLTTAGALRCPCPPAAPPHKEEPAPSLRVPRKALHTRGLCSVWARERLSGFTWGLCGDAGWDPTCPDMAQHGRLGRGQKADVPTLRTAAQPRGRTLNAPHAPFPEREGVVPKTASRGTPKDPSRAGKGEGEGQRGTNPAPPGPPAMGGEGLSIRLVSTAEPGNAPSSQGCHTVERQR